MQYRYSELDGETLIIEIEDGDTGDIVDQIGRAHV